MRSSIDWYPLSLAALVWVGTALVLRWRRSPKGTQLSLNVVACGMFLANLFFQFSMLARFRGLRWFDVAIWLAVLVAAGRGYFKDRMLVGYPFFVAGFSLLYAAFILFDVSTQSASMYPLAGLGLLMATCSLLITPQETAEPRGTR